MVVARLHGGTGNQLFQYAAGRTLAERHGVELAFDTSLLDRKFDNVTPRSYALGSFRVSQRIATESEIDALQARGLGVSGLVRKAVARVGPTKWRTTFYERSTRFDPAFYDLGSDVYLAGYFQSEKYFATIRQILVEEVRLARPVSPVTSEFQSRIEDEGTSVSLHFRRGDYVTNPAAAAHHGVLSVEYHRCAVREIAGSVRNPHFFVFSDDPDWAEEHLDLGYPATIVRGDGKTDAEDLMLIAACRHHIISNSSFSWWGAWLSDSDDKIVVAPRNWFANPEIDTSDIVPASWRRT